MARLKVTQTRSEIGGKQNQRDTLRSLGLHRIYATVAVDNVASRRVLERVGFTLVGTERRSVLVRDGMHDGAAYELLAEDLPAR